MRFTKGWALGAAACAVAVGYWAAPGSTQGNAPDSAAQSIAKIRTALEAAIQSSRATRAADERVDTRVAGNPWDDHPTSTSPDNTATSGYETASGAQQLAQSDIVPPQAEEAARRRMSPRLAAFAAANADRIVDVLMRYSGEPGSFDAARVEALGGQVLRIYENFSIAAVRIPASNALALASNASVSHLDLNARVYAASTAARQTANVPYSGAGTSFPVSPTLGIAVVDSGVAAHTDLNVVGRHVFNDGRSSFEGDLWDGFYEVRYDGSQGTDDWSSSKWTETDDDGKADTGLIRIGTDGCPFANNLCLTMSANAPTTAAIERRVRVDGAREARLYFDYNLSSVTGTADFVVEASSDDGKTWSGPLARVNAVGAGSFSYGTSVNLTPYLSGKTKFRVRVNDPDATARFAVDNLGVWFRTSTFYRDDFNSVSYARQNGNETWGSNWTETGDGSTSPSGGTIRVESVAGCPDGVGGCLRIHANGGVNDAVQRSMDLSNVFAAALSFDYRTAGIASTGEFVLEASGDGGTTWTVLQRFRTNTSVYDARYDLTPFVTANARLRFRVTNAGTTAILRIDNLEVNLERGNVNDLLGHGTHIAGIASGTGGSTGSYLGVARGARIHQVRVLDGRGRGTVADLIGGLDWILSNGAAQGIKVVNLSLGTGVTESNTTDPLVLAVERLWDAGFVVVASAGNYGEYGNMTITSPGTARKIITVGSLTDAGTGSNFADDYVSTYSSRGPTLIDHTLKPDLIAPGNRIIAAINADSRLRTGNPGRAPSCGTGCTGNYLELSGSSMATAMVSGAALLMLTKDPALSPSTVKARLMRSARKIAGDPTSVGAGVLDVDAALNATGVVSGQALSPQMERSAEGSAILVEDTALLWGNSAWSAGYLWQNGYLWSNNYTASNGYLWSDGYLWQNGYLWSNGYLWNNGYLWQNGYLWSNGYLWENAIAGSSSSARDETSSSAAQRGD
jgi:hypothetical protein